MKKALRIVSVLMILVMAAGMLASCNTGNETEAPKTTTPASTAGKYEIPEWLQGLDFDGEEIGIVVSGGELATRSITLPDDADPTYTVNVAVQQRNDQVEQLLNVVLVPKETVGMQAMVTHMREYFQSPDNTVYDIVGVYQYFDMGLAFGADVGSFYNFNSIEEEDMFIHPEEDYWDTNCYNVLAYEDAAFWITGDLSQEWLSTIFVSYVNAEMWKEYEDKIQDLTGVKGDIYDLVYANKWTIDLWCQLNELVYINKDGNEAVVSGEDQHGFCGYSQASGINNVIVDAMFSGSHVTFSKIVDGVPEIDYNNNNLKNYVNATRKLWNESKSYTLPYNGDNTAMNIFANGNTLMTVNTLKEAELSLADMTADYYILPPPMSTEAQGDYATTVGDSTTQFGIPKGTENLAASTATLEALGFFSKEIVTPEYYDNCLKGRYTRGDSDDAAKMIDFTRSKVYTDFVLLWAGSMTDSVSWYLRNTIGTNVITAEARIKQSMWGKQLNHLLEELESTNWVE